MAVSGLHRKKYHLLGHLLRYRTADPTCLRNRLPRPQPALVDCDPIRALPDRRLPSHNASSDEPPPNLGLRLAAPDIRMHIRLVPTSLTRRVQGELCRFLHLIGTFVTYNKPLMSSVLDSLVGNRAHPSIYLRPNSLLQFLTN